MRRSSDRPSPTRSPRCSTAPRTRRWASTHKTYDRIEVDEDALPDFVKGLDGSWAGLSLTMPLKRAVIPLLDGMSDTAASVEAVNTVVLTEDGRRLGDNTGFPA